LVLDVAHRLARLIEEQMGSEVIYTRDKDEFVALEERTEIATANRADLFLSIHANSSPLKAISGPETYYLNFTTSRTALDTATRENAASSKSVYELKDLLQKIALKDKVDESREFATRVQSALNPLTAPVVRTGTKQQHFSSNNTTRQGHKESAVHRPYRGVHAVGAGGDRFPK